MSNYILAATRLHNHRHPDRLPGLPGEGWNARVVFDETRDHCQAIVWMHTNDAHTRYFEVKGPVVRRDPSWPHEHAANYAQERAALGLLEQMQAGG